MLIRGSAQLLLLFFRSRPRLGWGIGCTALILVLASLLRASGEFPLMTRSGLAELFRQSAWEHALAGLPQQAPWPWAESSSGTSGTVSQLGLSAAVIKEGNTGEGEGSMIGPIQRAAAQDPHLPPAEFSGADSGDRATVTTDDGAMQVYRITGCNVVDPHLADTQPGVSDENPSLAACVPLVIQSTKPEPSAPSEPEPEHKL